MKNRRSSNRATLSTSARATAPPSRRNLSMRPGCVNCAWTAVPTTPGLVEIGPPCPGRSARRHPTFLSAPPRPFSDFVCRMKPGTDSQPGPLRFQPRISRNLRSLQRSRPPGGHRSETLGYRAMNPSAGFPMEQDRSPVKIWVVSHKPVAVAAGLGHMGNPPQRHPSKFRQFHRPGNGADRCRGFGLQRAGPLQSLPRMQVVCGGVSVGAISPTANSSSRTA